LYVGGFAVASNNTATSAGAGGSATLSDNTILGKVSVTKSDFVTISNNVISGGISLGGRDYINASIIDNTITGGDFGFGVRIDPTSYIFLISAGHTDAYISSNTIFDCTTAGIEVGGLGQIQADGPLLYNTAIICGNTIVNSSCGIDASVNEEIRNNIVAYNEIGINNGELIEGNLIVNNTYGIKGGNVIQNNTIVGNSVGVEGGFTTLVYNNIYNNSEYNVRFTSSKTPTATCNWWGTTNATEISQSIYDYKNDFYLGKVNFNPFLTEPNPEAPSTENPLIPEFPSWILLPLFLAATFVVTVFRKKTAGRNCTI
jgi:hypothetical protein